MSHLRERGAGQPLLLQSLAFGNGQPRLFLFLLVCPHLCFLSSTTAAFASSLGVLVALALLSELVVCGPCWECVVVIVLGCCVPGAHRK